MGQNQSQTTSTTAAPAPRPKKQKQANGARLALAAAQPPPSIVASCYRNTPLTTLAAKKGNSDEIAQLLHHHDVDINCHGEGGFTALHLACRNNDIPLMSILLQHGACIDSATETGITPLLEAIVYEQPEIAKALVAAGANPNACTTSGYSAAHLALLTKNKELIQLMFNRHANFFSLAATGATPLHVAASNGDFNLCDAILKLRYFVLPVPHAWLCDNDNREGHPNEQMFTCCTALSVAHLYPEHFHLSGPALTLPGPLPSVHSLSSQSTPVKPKQPRPATPLTPNTSRLPLVAGPSPQKKPGYLPSQAPLLDILEGPEGRTVLSSATTQGDKLVAMLLMFRAQLMLTDEVLV